ncbi:MAG: sodium:alanine symporter family protein [Spirochaetaceae bacterium]|jgi:AGCS family alanine or glycine:cation symporter|nr:sodium:alanine symporter family protein [Spirochaetaceae bacterium]
MEQFETIAGIVNGIVWGPWLLVLLFGTHVFMTVRTGFIQRKLGLGIKLSVTRETGVAGDVSQFGALTTALASTIGTGNIIGVGTAIASGGPGAVLWMWLTGVFGIATKYAESLIAVKYRVKDEHGMMLGGAMFALERGLKMKWLGVLFGIFAAFAAFGIGDGVQSNAVARIINENFDVPLWIPGVIMMVLTGLVLIGGIKWITNVCVGLVPIMSLLYVIGCIIILIIHRGYIVPAIAEIIKYAFTPTAIGGGLLGYTIKEAARFGIARGLFSNESGMGSAPIVASAAKTKNPARQALVSMTGTFWDTVIICLMTGLVVVSSAIANPSIDYSNGASLVNASFGQIPIFGKGVLTFGLVTFAFSTILGWSYYGEKGAEYLLGPKVIIPYRILYTMVVFVGATIPLGIVWNIADTLNGLMIIPNIVAVLLLSAVISQETNTYVYGDIEKVDTDPIPLRTDLLKKRG